MAKPWFMCLLVSLWLSFPATFWAQPAEPTNTPPPTNAPELQRLRMFGVDPTPKSLIEFLQKGFPQNTDLARLPNDPPERSQLAVDAMALLATARSTAAVDTLVEVARMTPPRGVMQLVEMDLQRTDPQNRAEFREKALRLLQFNAVNALGLIGDPRGLPAVQQVFAQENHVAARIQYALSLACLGDASGVPFLVEVIQQANRRESAAAAKVFYFITGEDFGYTDQTPVKARRTKARLYKEWLRTQYSTFRVDPRAVLQRRLAPDPLQPITPHTTRDLVKLSSFYFDFENKLRSREAREQLARAGKTINPDLEKIMFDEMEDLNVRMEAMNWYYEINREAAKGVLKKLRRDENPEIVEKAESLLEKIESPDQQSSSYAPFAVR
ncbi:MAG: hypothetical protein D6691_06155 [Candidatus Hydrogenedentota bacterium]|nr:MAG: hypothetical protein D6691_06155 [Candidatus Hydrogenedentota bacterium]